jgi:hypothetical protein
MLNPKNIDPSLLPGAGYKTPTSPVYTGPSKPKKPTYAPPPLIPYSTTAQALYAVWSGSPVTVVSSPPGAGKCLTGDTRVLDPRSGDLVAIRELAGRDDVDVTGLHTDWKLRHVSGASVTSNGVRPTWTLTTRLGRTITATDNHPFLGPKGWMLLRDLTVGMPIATPRELAYFGTEQVDDEIVSLIGLLIGDGACAATTPSLTVPKGNYAVRDEAARCASALGVNFHLKGSSEIDYSLPDPQSSRSRKNRLTAILERLDLRHTAEFKAIPAPFCRMPKHSIALLLNRLFATDGSVYVGKHGWGEVSYSTISPQLAADVQHLLLRFGVVAKLRTKHPKVYEGTGKNAYELVLSGRDSLLRFVKEIGALGREEKIEQLIRSFDGKAVNSNVDLLPIEFWSAAEPYFTRRGFWQEINLATGRRYNFDWHPNKRRPSRPVLSVVAAHTGDRALHDLAVSDVWWDAIVSIDYAGEAETFDLAMPTAHNFVANDLIVHNTTLVATVLAHLWKNTDMKIGVAAVSHSAVNDLAGRVAALVGPNVVFKAASKRVAESETLPAMVQHTTEATPQRHIVARAVASWKFIRVTPDDPGRELDLLVFDEAWQLTYSTLVAAASVARQVLMIGDPGQTEPIVRGHAHTWSGWDSPAAPGPVVMSQRDDAVTLTMPETFRVGAATVRALAPLYPFPFTSARPDRDIVGRSELESTVVPDDASVVALGERLAALAVDYIGRELVGVPGKTVIAQDDVAVVVARNVHVAATEAALLQRGFTDVTVGTANSLQGGQWHAVIALDPAHGQSAITNHSASLGRVCVMASRHMTSLMWVHDGNWKALFTDPQSIVPAGDARRHTLTRSVLTGA